MEIISKSGSDSNSGYNKNKDFTTLKCWQKQEKSNYFFIMK